MGMLKRTAVITYRETKNDGYAEISFSLFNEACELASREFDALAPADKKRTVVMWVAEVTAFSAESDREEERLDSNDLLTSILYKEYSKPRKGKPAVATKKEIWYVPFDYNEPQKPLMLIADSGKKVYGHE